MKKRVYSPLRQGFVGQAGGTKKKSSADYFDDCIICQGTKKAEEEGRSLGESELRELFDKANKSN